VDEASELTAAMRGINKNKTISLEFKQFFHPFSLSSNCIDGDAAVASTLE
jgi:hypothetical protein